MVYRKVDRLVSVPQTCACGDTGFVSLNEQWLVIVDATDRLLLASSKWSLQTDGGLYAIRGRLGKKEWLHRLILPAPELVDHRNGFGLDCRRHNLRPATSSQNQQNSKARAGTSAYKGVYWKKSHKKWHASIGVGGQHKSLGYFSSETEAAKAYNAAALNLYGQYARINNL